MAANQSPIFTGTPALVPSTTSPVVLLTQAQDYTGLSPYNALVFKAGSNGSFLQRLRFKALGSTTSATVARVYFIPGSTGHLASLLAAPGTPSGTPSSSGGTLLANSNYYATIVAVDATGALSAASSASTAVTTTGTTGSISWSWAASAGAASYRIYVSQTAGAAVNGYFTSSTNSFTQIAPQEGNATYGVLPATPTNALFWDEVALPVVTGINTTSTVTIDLPVNIALPANYQVLVGLGTTVTAGWEVIAVGGNY